MRISRLDLAGVLLIGSIATLHCSAWSNHPPDVDPINFQTALRSWDVTADSPHPPGYPLFVWLARGAAHLVGAGDAYQLVNLALLLGTALCLYLVFRHTARPEIGFCAAALLLTHPLAWAATVIAESYISDAFLTCAALACVFLLWNRPWAMVAGLAVTFFLLGLFRPVSCFLVLPLVAGAVLLAGEVRRPWLAGKACLAAMGSAILAYGLTAWMAGGLAIYRAASARVMGGAVRGSSVFAGAPLAAHVAMAGRLVGWNLLLAAPMLVLAALCLMLRGRGLWAPRLAKPLAIGLLWWAPPFAFYALVYYLKPTYQLIYLPALLIAAAWAIQEGLPGWGRPARWLLTGCLAAAQLAIFFLAPPSLPPQLFRLTHGYFARQDAAWEELLRDLAPLRRPGTLLVWVEHPSLELYALRLLDWPEPSAVPDPERRKLLYLKPSRMAWLPVTEESTTVSGRYDSAALIAAENGHARVKLVRFDQAETRQAAALLALAAH